MTRSAMRRRAIVPAAATAAARHMKLLRSEPAANQALAASPTQVKLWFSQRPELPVTSIKVKSGAGASAVERALAPLTRGAAANASVNAPIGAALAPGHYEVVWRTMARDGHVLNGAIPFDVGAAR
jgi:methionine-rich copper-binding protein CopC